MKVYELMSSTACSVEPETTIQQAAALMATFDVGVLPVLGGKHLVGIVTDRDLAVRALAAGLPGDTPVRAVMTRGVHACHADEDVVDVMLDMQLLQLRRVPVEDDDDEFVGMLSLVDLMGACSDEEFGRTFRRICSAQEPERERAAA